MKGNRLTIAVMFGMVFMVGFVTMFTGPLAAVVKAQFGASNALSQFGSSANFLAYLFMGIPCGMVLKRKGYRFTSLAAVSVGILGVALQILAGFVASFGVYVTGAFVAGLSMCMLNVTANPMMNTLGGGGNGGNRLVQYGCTFNSRRSPSPILSRMRRHPGATSLPPSSSGILRSARWRCSSSSRWSAASATW